MNLDHQYDEQREQYRDFHGTAICCDIRQKPYITPLLINILKKVEA